MADKEEHVDAAVAEQPQEKHDADQEAAPQAEPQASEEAAHHEAPAAEATQASHGLAPEKSQHSVKASSCKAASSRAASIYGGASSDRVGIAGQYSPPGHPSDASRRASSPSKQASQVSQGLTFSGPPNVAKAKPYARQDFSHSPVQLRKIGHDNQLLVKRLTEISTGASPLLKSGAADQHLAKEASSAVNRRKSAAVIAQENHALYQRLVGLRPSKDISRDFLERQHQADLKYRANCSTFKASGARSVSPSRQQQQQQQQEEQTA